MDILWWKIGRNKGFADPNPTLSPAATATDILAGKKAYAADNTALTGVYEPLVSTAPPTDWPDIHAIAAADVQAGYSYKYIYLLADDYNTLTFTAAGTHAAFKTSDGDFYTGTATHTWDKAQDIACSEGYKTRWVIVYTTQEAVTVSLPFEVLWLDGYSTKMGATGYTGLRRLRFVDGGYQTGLKSVASMFSSCARLVKVSGSIDLSACENTSMMFNNDSSLVEVFSTMDLSACTDSNKMFYACSSLLNVPDTLDLSACQNASYLFYACRALRSVPAVLDLSACTNAASLFQSCESLVKLPDILDLSICTNVCNFAGGCHSLVDVPDVLDVSAATDASFMFGYSYAIRKLPDIFDLTSATTAANAFNTLPSLLRIPRLTIAAASPANVAPYFAQCIRINAENRDSVATFDGGGVLDGGMVFYLPTVVTTRALTLNSNIKALFTAGEQTTIANAVTAKNFSLVW